MNIIVPAGLLAAGALTFYAGVNTGRLFYGNTRLMKSKRLLEGDKQKLANSVRTLAATNASLRRQLHDCRGAGDR